MYILCIFEVYYESIKRNLKEKMYMCIFFLPLTVSIHNKQPVGKVTDVSAEALYSFQEGKCVGPRRFPI